MACNPLSTSSSDSIKKEAFTGDIGEASFEGNFAVKYTRDQCGLTVVMDCNDQTEIPEISSPYVLDPANPCQYTVIFTSRDVCPRFSTNALWIFLNKWKDVWGVVYMVAGLFLCLVGRKLFQIAIFLITSLATCILIMMAFYTLFFKDDDEDYIGWIVLVCAGVIGIIVGILMTKFQRLGAALLAGWGGFTLGLLVNETVLYKTESLWWFWGVGLAFALVAALLTFVIYNHVIILTTSFMGAYLFWRGVSMYAGGFPNEFNFID